MPNLTTLVYGSYNFSPVPFINLSQDTITNKDGRIGTKYSLTLTGALSTIPDMAGGITNVITLQNNLRNAFASDGMKLELACNSTPLLICYPKLSGPIVFEKTNNNWVYTTNYTIELEFEDFREDLPAQEPYAPYVEQSNETWNVEFVDDQNQYYNDLPYIITGVTGTGGHNQRSGYIYPDANSGCYYGHLGGSTYSGEYNYLLLKVSHNLNAVGQRHYIDLSGASGMTGAYITGYIRKEAWEYARDWCIGRLNKVQSTGVSSTMSGVLNDSGVLNLNICTSGVSGVLTYYPYNHVRAVSRSETQGSYSVDESWIVALSGTGNFYTGALRATEDYEINIAEHDGTDIVECSINGTINGWESRNYGTGISGACDFTISETKIQAAKAYWATIYPRVYSRCQYYLIEHPVRGSGSHSMVARNLNIIPLAKTVAYSPNRGTINYNISYDDRPGVRFISGALAETVTMDHNLATDVVGQLQIMGRSAGAIVQSMNTYTNPTLSVNLECTMPNTTGTGLIGFMSGIPRTQVNSFLCQFQADLTGNYSSVHVIENREGWSPPKYTRNITWLYTLCSTGSIFSGVC